MLTMWPTLDICGVGHPWAPAQCHWVEGWGRSQGFHPRSPTGFWISFLCPRFQVGLDVILRPGPFIDAERDFGGLPYWLLKWAGFFWDQKSTQGGGRKAENQWPKVLGSSEVLVRQIVLKVNLFLCLQTSCIDIFQTSGSVLPPRRPHHNGSSRLRQIHWLRDYIAHRWRMSMGHMDVKKSTWQISETW